MSKNITIIDQEYKEWITDLSMRYRRSQIKAAVKVNTEMLGFYWELGRDISKYDLDNKYGSRFYSILSKDLQRELPNVTGLTERNIRYMKSFYLLYSQEKGILPQAVAELPDENVPQAVAESEDTIVPQVVGLFQVPWGHHRVIIDKVKGDRNKALFFVRKTIEEGWSLRDIIRKEYYDGRTKNRGVAADSARSKRGTGEPGRRLPDIQSGQGRHVAAGTCG